MKPSRFPALLRSVWAAFAHSRKLDSSATTAMELSKTLAEGNFQLQAGNLDRAISHYRWAVELEPSNDDAWLRLGYALKENGQLKCAIEALSSSIKKNDRNSDAHYLVGDILLASGKFSSAAQYFLTALNIDPTKIHVYRDAITASVRAGNPQNALKIANDSIRFFPEHGKFHYYHGELLAQTGQFENAINAYSRATQLNPDDAEALAGLGNAERHVGHTENAINHLRSAIALDPTRADWHSDLLFTLQYSGTLTQAELFAEHRKYSALFETPLKINWDTDTKLAHVATTRRLRIGYVSGDFRAHSVAFFIEPVLRYHDRKKFEVYCYYTHPIRDTTTSALQLLSEHWRPCADLTDINMANQIRIDGIDILVDLSGHTGYNRLGVFARRPAKVQMTWLGYQSSTGLEAIDYRITDAAVDPPGQTEQYHTEKLIRLFAGAVFQPYAASPDVTELPCLATGIFTFGCLNNPAKITDAFIAVVAEILRSTEKTQFLIGNMGTAARKHLFARFDTYGVSREKIITFDKLPLAEYLNLHSRIDIALDTFPYNGGTTTLHSLWMGVPVIALAGETSITRVGSETMRGLGLSQFSCEDVQAYIRQAVALCSQKNELRQIRRNLRSLLQFQLVDQAKRFTQELELAYSTAHQKLFFSGQQTDS